MTTPASWGTCALRSLENQILQFLPHMAKKRKKYVAPIGKQLPEAPKNPGRGDLWLWIGECIGAVMSWVPLELAPDTMTWSDPHEAMRKELGRRSQ